MLYTFTTETNDDILQFDDAIIMIYNTNTIKIMITIIMISKLHEI